jgi:DNA-3-methyladenine glycosylase II
MNSAIEKNLAKADPVLHKIILQVAKPQIISTTNVFHDLMSCIIEQQIHYRSTKKIFHKMLLTAGLEQLTPENFHQFEEKSLSTIKLSAAKYETMLRVLDYWQTNSIIGNY